jgi:hypothetical protein
MWQLQALVATVWCSWDDAHDQCPSGEEVCLWGAWEASYAGDEESNGTVHAMCEKEAGLQLSLLVWPLWHMSQVIQHQPQLGGVGICRSKGHR